MHQVPGGGRRTGWEQHEAQPGRGREARPEPLAHLYTLVRGILRAGEVGGVEADDLVQDACLALVGFARPPEGVRESPRAARAWESAVVRNRLKALLRRRSVRDRASGAGRCGPFGPADATCDGGFEHLDEDLDPPLASLPAELRSAVSLVLAGLPVGEAACTLDLTDAELQRRALLAAWTLAEGEPPALDAGGTIPRRASLRGAVFRAVRRRRRAGWGWPQLAAVLGCGPEELRRRAERHFAQDPG